MDFDGFRFWGSFLLDLFSFLYNRAQFDDCVDMFEGVFGWFIFMALVSSIVSLLILSAWVIFGVWTLWWLNWTMSGVISAPVFSDTTFYHR